MEEETNQKARYMRLLELLGTWWNIQSVAEHGTEPVSKTRTK